MTREELEGYLTVNEVSELMGVTPQAIRSRINRGGMEAIHIGGKRGIWLISKQTLKNYVAIGSGKHRRLYKLDETDGVWQ